MPGYLVDDPLSSGHRRSRLPFRPFRLLHSALIENKALPPSEGGLPHKLVVSARTLEYRHCGRGAGAGVPFVGRALFAAGNQGWGDGPVALR